ncbi:MAG: hypothetical protein HFI70_08225 [Lachnospiraceae bacterium]|nr:hypothetical protein [Lachnospiraceae bacterium]
MQEVTNTIKKLDTGDTLKNIFIMAPMLDEMGQNRVFGLICGLLSGGIERQQSAQRRR